MGLGHQIKCRLLLGMVLCVAYTALLLAQNKQSTTDDRIPVIVDPDNFDLWLDPGMTDVASASDLLKPFDARAMRSYPISSRINHVANDDEECSRPVELAQIQDQLF